MSMCLHPEIKLWVLNSSELLEGTLKSRTAHLFQLLDGFHLARHGMQIISSYRPLEDNSSVFRAVLGGMRVHAAAPKGTPSWSPRWDTGHRGLSCSRKVYVQSTTAIITITQSISFILMLFLLLLFLKWSVPQVKGKLKFSSRS